MKLRLNTQILVIAATACGMAFAGPLTVKLTEPGTLARKVGDKKKHTTRSIKIIGGMNTDDVRWLRDMAGSDSLWKKTSGKLRRIDLSQASFVPDGKAIYAGNDRFRITGAHTLPPTFLYRCPVEEIVLPEKLDTIGPYALAWTGLRELNIPQGVVTDLYALSTDTLLRSLKLPDMKGEGITPSNSALDSIQRLEYGDVGYISAGSFDGYKNLEEVVFNGLIGHMDGYVFTDCPKLKRIIFRGPVNSTGGRQFVKNCPSLEEVRFDGLVFGTGFGKPVDCGSFTTYTQNGKVLYGDSSVFTLSTPKEVVSDPALKKQLKKLFDYKKQALQHPSLPFLEVVEIGNCKEDIALAKAAGETAFLDSLKANALPIALDMEKSKLQLLRESPAYATEGKSIEWSYTAPSDSVLALDRKYFNLDSIAGTGNDVSKMKNLMYWIHDLVRHDGNSYNPKSRSLIDIFNVCRDGKRGVNCRMMAIMLTEALLAEGIPARYLTCQPKLWQFDSDCHVITMAWSDSLQKWIWLDPTFAAYVTDDKGLLLHPGEVRERLIAGLPLVLNADANWNHKEKQTKEDYLDRYMAKNLYYISAITANRPNPEGANSTRSTYVLLAPEGSSRLPGHNIVTDCPEVFFAPPAKK